MPTPQRWLLIPMQPTPNGRLHLGHGGGPYLRADIIARAMRRDGHTAHIVTGSDAYENWVLATAHSTGRTPEQTCQHYHAGIAEDLRHLDIQLDAWIDPLHPDHRADYHQLHRDLLATLRKAGIARQETERIPIGAHTGRAIIGTFLAGTCPTCQAPAGGNTCTACGSHFQPHEIGNPHSRLTDEPITWTDQAHWFASPTNPATVLDKLAATGLDVAHLDTARRYLTRTGGRIRLTQPGDWGIPSPDLPDGHVLANPYYTYSLYCAHSHARATSTPNALTPESGTTAVGLFGTDNSIAGLVAPHVLAHPDHHKPFDHTVINHMLHFAGRKCSTSKRHGIWISELRDTTNITTDELRYFLASLPLDHAVGDFNTDSLTTTVNDLRRWNAQRLRPALHALRPTTTAPESIDSDPLRKLLDQQRQHLTPPHIDLTAAIDDITQWTHNQPADLTDPDHALAWLAGTALLTEPVMPTLARHIREALGTDSGLGHHVNDGQRSPDGEMAPFGVPDEIQHLSV
jgi:methionyl-tRNA synthetase